MQIAQDKNRPIVWRLLAIWCGIGLQSFGGGASTLLLIRRAFVEQRALVSADEMSQFWNLCLFTPGINLLALTVLIGRKLGGPGGIAASLAGLLLPSATITCVLAAGFETVQHSTMVHAILRGVIPATAGIMGLVGLDFARPIVQRGYQEGAKSLGLGFAVIAIAAAAIVVFKLSVIAVLAGAALIGVAAYTPWRAITPAGAAAEPGTNEQPS